MIEVVFPVLAVGDPLNTDKGQKRIAGLTQMYLTCPKCKEMTFERISRDWWLRLFPRSRRFRCYICFYSKRSLFGHYCRTVNTPNEPSVDLFLVQADDVIYGPVSLHDLQVWAKIGRLHGSHQVSTNGGKDWQDAARIEALQLTSLVCLNGGKTTYLLHPQAVKELAAEGAIPARSIVSDTLTGETVLLG